MHATFRSASQLPGAYISSRNSQQGEGTTNIVIDFNLCSVPGQILITTRLADLCSGAGLNCQSMITSDWIGGHAAKERGCCCNVYLDWNRDLFALYRSLTSCMSVVFDARQRYSFQTAICYRLPLYIRCCFWLFQMPQTCDIYPNDTKYFNLLRIHSATLDALLVKST